MTKPANGWNDAPSQTATFDLPLDLAEGTLLYARARVLDPNGAVGLRESEHFAVADDATAPVIDDFSARLAGAPVTHLFIGEELYLELRARDGETEVKTVALELDRTDLFPGTLTATLVTGTTDLYRTGTLAVPAGMTTFIPITRQGDDRRLGRQRQRADDRIPDRARARPRSAAGALEGAVAGGAVAGGLRVDRVLAGRGAAAAASTRATSTSTSTATPSPADW